MFDIMRYYLFNDITEFCTISYYYSFKWKKKIKKMYIIYSIENINRKIKLSFKHH